MPSRNVRVINNLLRGDKRMNELMTIENVRVKLDENGTAFIHIEDAARGLGFVDRKYDGTEYVRWTTMATYLDQAGFSQTFAKDDFIPENAFYLLAMRANSETAKAFQKKVANDILPSIRKHGMYATEELLDNPDLAIRAFTKLKEEREKRIALEQKVEADKPLVLFAETCCASKDSILVRELAKLACKNGVEIGEKRLWKKLREWGVVNGKNEPYQTAFDKGWFEAKQGTYCTPYGSDTYRTYKITPRGQIHVIERLRKEQENVISLYA